MLKRINFYGIFLIIMVTALLFAVGFKRMTPQTAKTVYQVYLNGEKIGLLENKDELYNLIDDTQQSIKQKFGVSKVYPPSGLEMVEYTTYDTNLSSAKDIYNKISEESEFTILGYTITITGDDKDPVYINVLDKSIIEPAFLNAVSTFITTDSLNAYLNGTQLEITDTGKTIENIYFDEDITVKENYLSVSEDIITTESDLTQYLLFGTLESQSSYTVEDGDTVETVAYNNKLSNEELLIANPSLSSVNSLLSAGQTLNIGLINPLFTVVEESEVVEDVEKAYTTEYEKDSSKYASQSYVKQEGQNGVDRITEKVQKKNGEIMNLVVSNTKEISATINKIVVKGTKTSSDYNFNYYPPAASSTDWGWPTISPYVITSYFGYRWGKLHAGIDISGSGYGSPIYASTDGVVVKVNKTCANQGYYGSSCGNGLGNYVEINASNGYVVFYAHIKNNVAVSVGQTVSKGQLLGYMGNSGSSTGTHLHFEIRDASGQKYNPCKVAFKC